MERETRREGEETDLQHQEKDGRTEEMDKKVWMENRLDLSHVCMSHRKPCRSLHKKKGKKESDEQIRQKRKIKEGHLQNKSF